MDSDMKKTTTLRQIFVEAGVSKGLSIWASKVLFDCFQEILWERLKEEKEVLFKDFGTFRLVKAKARERERDGRRKLFPSHYRISFRFSRTARDRLNLELPD
jgi:nucleoid DNA-binding protein